jgi:predicted metal-dependent enzyme (double-stranded beta helix superfamily)
MVLSLESRRNAVVKQMIDRIRTIEARNGVNRFTLEKIKTVLIELAEQPDLFPSEEFPPPDGKDNNLYELWQEDGRLALYLSSANPGKTSPPHNHTTWAAIAAISGAEENLIYERIDDETVPGRGQLKVVDKVVVKPGVGIALMPDDVHSIHVVGTAPTQHLHLYGVRFDLQKERIYFDRNAGTYHPFPPNPNIR